MIIMPNRPEEPSRAKGPTTGHPCHSAEPEGQPPTGELGTGESRADQGADDHVDATVITPHEAGADGAEWDPTAPIPAPLCLHTAIVLPAWTDYNGHLSEYCFLLAFGDSTDAFFRHLGVEEHYRAEGHSLYTAETHLHHRREAYSGDPLLFTVQVLGLDDKRLHLFHTMHHSRSGEVLATAEQLLLHVDTRVRRVAPFPVSLLTRLEAVREAHAHLPVPDAVGHVMEIPPRNAAG
ncbi:thioesterase family protein [Streptomyces sp. NPDC048564]|uniref:thioesterase family protein n=1 Tax=Streptomyces sp. NPDC048564 TaxID=3155760 RepID=UPI003447DC88